MFRNIISLVLFFLFAKSEANIWHQNAHHYGQAIPTNLVAGPSHSPYAGHYAHLHYPHHHQHSPGLIAMASAPAAVSAHLAELAPAPVAPSVAAPVAIISSKQVGFREFVQHPTHNQATNIFIDGPVNPVNLVYRSLSSPVNVEHKHIGTTGSFKQTNSVDDAYHHVHTVTKPVIQELHEIIAPVRKVKQEVLPVQEEIQTLISKSVQGSPAHGVQTAKSIIPSPIITQQSHQTQHQQPHSIKSTQLINPESTQWAPIRQTSASSSPTQSHNPDDSPKTTTIVRRNYFSASVASPSVGPVDNTPSSSHLFDNNIWEEDNQILSSSPNLGKNNPQYGQRANNINIAQLIDRRRKAAKK